MQSLIKLALLAAAILPAGCRPPPEPLRIVSSPWAGYEPLYPARDLDYIEANQKDAYARMSKRLGTTEEDFRTARAGITVSRNVILLRGDHPVTLRLVAGGVGVDRVGALFAEYDLAPRFAQAGRNATVQASLVGGLMLAVAIAVALLLHILVSRRVEKNADAAKRFAAGDLDERVQSRGRDELAELGHAFDDMASQRKME